MNSEKLGRKIREVRLAKKMTQSEVVGSFITRNMLSQIESGVASPSVKTLEYLSEVLGIPMSELVADSELDSRDKLLNAKGEFRAGQYESVVDIIGEVQTDDLFYDEYCALLAKAYRNLNDTEKADHYASLGIYAKE